MLIKLAWRNIWRNKRRTLITVASIFFAVFFSVFMNSFQKGTWARMLDNIVNYYYGYIQIHGKGYWDDRTLDESIVLTRDLETLPETVKGLKSVVPRLETFTLLSSGEHTSVMMIVGTDPVREQEMTNLKGKLTEGVYFSANDHSLLLADGVKELLHVGLGDTLIVMTQGYQGTQAKLDNDAYEIMNWKELLPELVEAQKTDAAGNYIFLLVLYLIISFGIFGTILMMTKERLYEYGVLIAVGMSRAKLALTTWLEIVFMTLIGVVFGMLGALPVVIYFKNNPIDFSNMGEDMSNTYEKWGFDPIFPTVLEAPLFFNQALLVLIISSLLATYAIWQIFKLKPVEAMKT
ncbi:MAG: hypothetical protein CSA40_00765 [Flavobacteriales bacterium]|nr:MAG: hypothetical protein CSA40_00765 [Flavobacteriales bacterium]